MGRLSDKMNRATDAIASFETDVEKDVDKIIARTQELHQKREKVMTRKHIYLDQHMGDLTEFEKDLDAFDGKNEPSPAGENSKPAGWENGDAYQSTHPKR